MAEDTDIATTQYIAASILNAGNLTAVGRVIELNKRGASNVSVQTVFSEDGGTTQDLVATVLFEVSIDPRAKPGSGDEAAAKWVDVTTLGLTVEDITSGEGSVMDIFSSMTVGYFRQTITRTAGEGDARSYIAGHD